MSTKCPPQSTAPKNRAPEDRFFEHASSPKETDDADHRDVVEPNALKLLLKQFGELREFSLHYLSAKCDGVKLSVQSAVLSIVLASLGFVVVSGLFVLASWFVLSGTADGLSELFVGRLWAAKIMTGLLVLAGLGIGVCCLVVRRKAASRERTIQKYEKRQAGQNGKFGHSVTEQAAAASERN